MRKDLIFWTGNAIIVLAFVAVVAALSTIAYHYLTPVQIHFLNERQLDSIEIVIFTSSVIAGVAGFFRWDRNR